MSSVFFFFNDTATTEIYTLSLHDALPISLISRGGGDRNESPLRRAFSSLLAARHPEHRLRSLHEHDRARREPHQGGDARAPGDEHERAEKKRAQRRRRREVPPLEAFAKEPGIAREREPVEGRARDEQRLPADERVRITHCAPSASRDPWRTPRAWPRRAAASRAPFPSAAAAPRPRWPDRAA